MRLRFVLPCKVLRKWTVYLSSNCTPDCLIWVAVSKGPIYTESCKCKEFLVAPLELGNHHRLVNLENILDCHVITFLFYKIFVQNFNHRVTDFDLGEVSGGVIKPECDILVVCSHKYKVKVAPKVDQVLINVHHLSVEGAQKMDILHIFETEGPYSHRYNHILHSVEVLVELF